MTTKKNIYKLIRWVEILITICTCSLEREAEGDGGRHRETEGDRGRRRETEGDIACISRRL